MREDPVFLRYYADVMEAEASKRTHQAEFSAWLRGCAEKARKQANIPPVQGELF